MAEVIVGIIAAAFAFPTCIQALTHGVRRLKEKNNHRQLSSSSQPQRVQLAGHTSHAIKTHHTLNSSHSIQLDGQTHHTVEHNVFFHLSTSATVLAAITSAMLYVAYHLGHSHGHHGRQAVLQGLDMAIHPDEQQCPIQPTESPLTAAFLSLIALLEPIGHVVLSSILKPAYWLWSATLWLCSSTLRLASAPIHILRTSVTAAHTLGRHGAALLEATTWITHARAWTSFAVLAAVKLVFALGVAGASSILVAIGLDEYVLGKCTFGKSWNEATLLGILRDCGVISLMILTAATAATAAGAVVSLW